MFVLVPISVQQPPKIDAYEMGSNNFEEATPRVRESPIATGSRITTTGVLLIKAEKQATAVSNNNINGDSNGTGHNHESITIEDSQ